MRRRKELKLTGKDLLAFDFGHHTSKFVYGKVVRSSIVIEKAMEFSTPGGAIEGGAVVDVPLLANRIKELVRAERIRANYAVATIENSEIITREIVLPTTSEAQMEKVLEFEAQQYLPIEINSHIVQSRMIETFQEDGVSKTRFLTSAMPEHIARGYHTLFQAAALNGVALDIHSNSIDKLVQMGILLSDEPAFSQKASAVIDFGYNHINVMLFENGKFKLNRLISQGVGNIDRNLMSSFGYSRQQADEVKRSLNLNDMLGDSLSTSDDDPDESTQRAADVMRTVLDGWVTELERVFRFFTTRIAANTVDTLYIYGGMMGFPGFMAYLQDATGIETRCACELKNVTFRATRSHELIPYINALGSMIRR
jgi:type IV pilus assembly protein PilM